MAHFDIIQAFSPRKIKSLNEKQELTEVVIAGQISQLQQEGKWPNFQLTDATGSITVTTNKDTKYFGTAALLDGMVVVIHGRLEEGRMKAEIIINMAPIDEAKSTHQNFIVACVDDGMEVIIQEFQTRYPGNGNLLLLQLNKKEVKLVEGILADLVAALYLRKIHHLEAHLIK